MEYQPTHFPPQSSYGHWSDWYSAPQQHRHQSYNEESHNGFYVSSSKPYWHHRHASFDHRSSCVAQTPLAPASSPSSLARTSSWPTLPTSSAWTSPLVSPEGGLPFTTPAFAGGPPYSGFAASQLVSGTITCAETSKPFQFTTDGPGIVAAQQYTPTPQQHCYPFATHDQTPALSASSSPAMFSHTPILTTRNADGRCGERVVGLGIGAVQEITYPVWNKDETNQDPAPPTDLNRQRLTKRRKRKAPSSAQHKKPFHCPHCSYTFDRKCNLTCHLKTHGVGRGRVICPEPGCGKEYGRRADVNRHIRTIHEGASFRCDDCGKRFGRSDILQRHDGACTGRKKGAETTQEDEWTSVYP